MADERQTRIAELKRKLAAHGDNPDVRAELARLEAEAAKSKTAGK
jgi:hypothetical protein